MAMMEADFEEGDLYLCFGGDDDIAADVEANNEDRWPTQLRNEEEVLLSDDWISEAPKKEIVLGPGELTSPVPAVPDPLQTESGKTDDLRERLHAKSRYHCLTHTPFKLHVGDAGTYPATASIASNRGMW